MKTQEGTHHIKRYSIWILASLMFIWTKHLGAGLPTLEEYDPLTDTWTKKANMPTARGTLASSEVNGKIYAIGGSNWGMMLSTVEEYDTGFRESQSVSPAGKLPTLWGKLKATH